MQVYESKKNNKKSRQLCVKKKMFLEVKTEIYSQ